MVGSLSGRKCTVAKGRKMRKANLLEYEIDFREVSH